MYAAAQAQMHARHPAPLHTYMLYYIMHEFCACEPLCYSS